MKQFINIILLVCILTGCSNKTSNIEKRSSLIDSLKHNYIPILIGVWVSTDYINEIEKTKSPNKSSSKLNGIVTMLITGDTQGDSIQVGASWNNHEGYSFTTYLKPGQNKNNLQTDIIDYKEASNFYELGYEKIGNETNLFLYHYDKQNKLIDKRKFTKVADEKPDNDLGWEIQYVVNQKLISGDFLIYDSINNTTTVSLKSNGSLSGHPDFNEYYIYTDFIGGPETSLDNICFNLQSKNPICFAFQFNNDTIYLYSTKGDEEAGEDPQIDQLKYRLVKQ
ncbi:MAG: hypothetical protein NVV82_20130 [Sporocytophaga sp.]|nr:hypothetical protein [Sporocytophaga sp.]